MYNNILSRKGFLKMKTGKMPFQR